MENNNVENKDELLIDGLLNEYNSHRQAIKNMIVEMESLKENINTLIPESIDKRFKFYFEERMKTLTLFFNSLLDMRKEIIKSVKDEIELRRKLDKTGKDDDIADFLDIKKIAKKVESFQKFSRDKLEDSKEKVLDKVSVLS